MDQLNTRRYFHGIERVGRGCIQKCDSSHVIYLITLLTMRKASIISRFQLYFLSVNSVIIGVICWLRFGRQHDCDCTTS